MCGEKRSKKSELKENTQPEAGNEKDAPQREEKIRFSVATEVTGGIDS